MGGTVQASGLAPPVWAVPPEARLAAGRLFRASMQGVLVRSPALDFGVCVVDRPRTGKGEYR